MDASIPAPLFSSWFALRIAKEKVIGAVSACLKDHGRRRAFHGAFRRFRLFSLDRYVRPPRADVLWRLPGAGLPSVTKKDIEDYFGSHGTGKITEIKLMNGFGFIEYEDAMDARDVVPGMFSSL